MAMASYGMESYGFPTAEMGPRQEIPMESSRNKSCSLGVTKSQHASPWTMDPGMDPAEDVVSDPQGE